MPLQQHTLLTFKQLGEKINSIEAEELNTLYEAAFIQNRWFSEDSIKAAFDGLKNMLESEKMDFWSDKYSIKSTSSKKVGIIMAGNIPMVGFHDLMCVLLSGHKAVIKLSSQDQFLMKKILDWLVEIDPDISSKYEIKEQLKDIEAVIATGSDNTARYFHYYFSKIPSIIRKNRTSVTWLTGNETSTDIKNLGKDIFQYFGLGCRNVSKIYYPEDFDFTLILDEFQQFESILMHDKYRNNYDYHKSILLINREKHLDTGFALFKPSMDLVSPTGVTYIESYKHNTNPNDILKLHKDKIQCIISNAEIEGKIPFGKAQSPELWDYADNVDTLNFLTSL